MGLFQKPQISLHFSPFTTREKSGSEVRRTIIDLSWPKGASVIDGISNNTYLSTDFQLHYPSVEGTIIQHLNAGTNIFKIDISLVFRHTRIGPGDIDLLGLP